MIVVAFLWLLGLSWAKIDQVKNNKQSFHPNYPAVRQRFARAQPAIYAPDKALSWVDNYYERSYVSIINLNNLIDVQIKIFVKFDYRLLNPIASATR